MSLTIDPQPEEIQAALQRASSPGEMLKALSWREAYNNRYTPKEIDGAQFFETLHRGCYSEYREIDPYLRKWVSDRLREDESTPISDMMDSSPKFASHHRGQCWEWKFLPGDPEISSPRPITDTLKQSADRLAIMVHGRWRAKVLPSTLTFLRELPDTESEWGCQEEEWTFEEIYRLSRDKIRKAKDRKEKPPADPLAPLLEWCRSSGSGTQRRSTARRRRVSYPNLQQPSRSPGLAAFRICCRR